MLDTLLAPLELYKSLELSAITLYLIIFDEYDDRIRLAGLTGSDYIRIFCTDDYSVAAKYSDMRIFDGYLETVRPAK